MQIERLKRQIGRQSVRRAFVLAGADPLLESRNLVRDRRSSSSARLHRSWRAAERHKGAHGNEWAMIGLNGSFVCD